jgi:putative hydrolase of the HAD superfamily
MPALPINIPGRVVVFDYGEVISHSPSEEDRRRLLEVGGIPEALESTFWQRYWHHRPPLDQGSVRVSDYWKTLASELGLEWTASQRHALWVADFRGWWSVEPATLDLIERLHDGGTRVALLSNAGFDFASGFRHSPMSEFFEVMYVSAEMDAIKPDPEIYREVAAGLGITLDQMIFVDNKLENTDAAAALGVTVHHFTTVEGLQGFLESLEDTARRLPG